MIKKEIINKAIHLNQKNPTLPIGIVFDFVCLFGHFFSYFIFSEIFSFFFRPFILPLNVVISPKPKEDDEIEPKKEQIV